MANPRLQLRRGTQSPAAANITTALSGEPFFDTSNDNLWVADGSDSFVHIGGASYTSRVDAFLTSETASVGSIVVLKESTEEGTNKVSLKAPAALAGDVTFQLPGTNGTADFYLKTDGNGVTSWAAVPSGSFTIAADSGSSDTFTTGQTLTFEGTDPIDTTVSDNKITISAKDATTTTKGVASFSATDFSVSSGAVSINSESIEDIVGAMVAGNTASGIDVSYNDTDGKLNFNVADFTITLGGDLSGSVTINDLANATLTATIAADSVALGTDTTGNYVTSVATSSGITGGAAGSEGATLTLSLDIAGLTGESAVVDADVFAFYDDSATANRKVTAANLATYVLAEATGDVTFSNGVAQIANDSVDLGTHTTGNYVADVTAGAGLAKTSTAGEGQTVDLAVGAGTGIVVNSDDVALKNNANLTNDTVLGWDATNGQLVNSPVTYSGNDVSVAGDLTVTGNDIKSSGGTTAITLSGSDVTIAGNLTVSGSSTVLNTETLKVEDRVIELGLVNGAAPTTATTWDTAVAFNYHATTAKKSAIVWIDNAGFELASEITETADTGNADPQISVGARASLGVASLYIGSIGTPGNEVINASKELINVTVDCGTY
jgi:hypothetical protein